jgi:hypothetical protein
VPPPARSPVRGQARQRRVASRYAAVGASALLAAGCGSVAAHGPGSAGTTSSASTSPAAGTTAKPGTTSAAKILLRVSFSGSDGIAQRHYTLQCEPDGGNIADAAAACAKLMKHGANMFGPLPRHVACPMIIASGGRATVSGTYLGRPVHVTVTDGGCDLSRWAELAQIFK